MALLEALVRQRHRLQDCIQRLQISSKKLLPRPVGDYLNKITE